MRIAIENLNRNETVELSAEAMAATAGGIVWKAVGIWVAKKVAAAVGRSLIYRAVGNRMCGRGRWTNSPFGPICKAS